MPQLRADRMNVLVLSKDPVRAAMFLSDRDLVYFPSQSYQLLGSACILEKVRRVPVKLSHKTNPWVAWIRQSTQNYEWFWTHWAAMILEYERRYGRKIFYEIYGHHDFFYTNKPEHLPDIGLTAFPKYFPELPQYAKIENPVKAYREYYRIEKADSHWKDRSSPPDWFVK